jgi:ATP-binding cassette subfamily B protein
VRPYRAQWVIIVVTSIISSAGMVVVPLVVKTVIDGPLADGDRAGIARWSAFIALIALVEVFLAYTRRWLLTLTSTGLETAMRDDFYAQLQRLDVGFHDKWQSGQLLSRAMTDLSIIRRFVGFGAIFFVLIAVQVVAIFSVLLFLDVPLALLTFVAAVPVVWLCLVFERQYMLVVRRIQDQTGDLTTTIEEGAKGIRILKAFGRGAEAFGGYQRQATEIYDTQMERIRLHTRFVWVLGVIPNLTLTAVLLAGALSVGAGRLTLGGLVAFVSYVLMLVFPLEVLAWIMALAGEAETAATRIYEVFDTPAAIEDRPGAVALLEPRGEVRFDGVSFAYDGRDDIVLRDIDLTVAAGEAIAVIGATGSGKTTLVTLLTRLVDPTQGRVLVDGHDLRDLAPGALAEVVALVPQQAFLFDDTVRGNVALGSGAPDDDVWAALRTAQADGFVAALPAGLDTRLGERGTTLSGGQRQRLSLARALLRRPRLLVMDDATSAVDPEVEARILAALRQGAEGSTVLVVAYRKATIALADEVVYLEDGRVDDQGTHAELLARNPGYADLVNAYEQERTEQQDLDDAGGTDAEVTVR